MRYQEDYPEHLHQRDYERYNRERSHQQQNYLHDAQSRWEEPATPHDLYRNRQPEQEGRFRREGQFHGQQSHQQQYYPSPDQNQQHRNSRHDWDQQQQHRNNTQQAPDRWRAYNWQQPHQNDRQYPSDQYWNEQDF